MNRKGSIKAGLALLVVSTSWQCAIAGPLEGELFGYKVGAKYPVTAQTKGYFVSALGQAVLIAEKPEMPTEFNQLELIASPKSFSIANIYASAEFADEQMASALEAKYADLLNTMYGSKCSIAKAYLGEALKLLCSKQFELTVHKFKPSKPGEKYKVHVGLRVDNASAAGKRMEAQFAEEWSQLVQQGRKGRLEEARKGQALKGLQ